MHGHNIICIMLIKLIVVINKLTKLSSKLIIIISIAT